MKRHLANITICTAAMLAFTLIFGYTFSIIRDIRAMDLYHCSAKDLGSEMMVSCGDAGSCDYEEAETAEITKGYIEKSMSESGILSSVKIDYEDKCIVCRVLTDGIAQAVQDGNDEKWEEIVETATGTSSGWGDTIREAGLEDWHFCLVIVNDYYPKNALLISTDGRTVYNCRTDAESDIA